MRRHIEDCRRCPSEPLGLDPRSIHFMQILVVWKRIHPSNCRLQAERRRYHIEDYRPPEEAEAEEKAAEGDGAEHAQNGASAAAGGNAQSQARR